MANFKTVSTLVVDCSDWGFGEFNVLVVPDEGITEKLGKTGYEFYLRHPKYGVVVAMFGLSCDTPEEAADLAYYNAPDYIPEFIEECGDFDD